MTVLDAVTVLMTYVGYEAQQVNSCIDALEHFVTNEDVSPIEGVKSIRFDSDTNVVGPLRKQASVEHPVVFKGLRGAAEESNGVGLEYSIHTETGYRYALICRDIPKSLFLRVFTESSKFNPFKGNNKITVSKAFEYNGFTLIEYRSEGSAIIRHAMLMDPNAVFNLDEVQQKIKDSIQADTTHLFGE